MRGWRPSDTGWSGVLHASGRHLRLMALLLVPAIALLYLGIQSLRGESAARARLIEETYRSIADVVRARIDAQIAELDRIIATELGEAGNPGARITRLLSIEQSHASLEPIVLVARDGTPIYPPEHNPVADEPWATASGGFRQRLALAEDAEFRLQQPSHAVALYARAFQTATTEEQQTVSLNGQARCELKDERPTTALATYARLIELTTTHRPIQARRALIARHQVAAIHARLQDRSKHAAATLDLFKFLLDHRLILDSDTYDFYRRQIDEGLSGFVFDSAQRAQLELLRQREQRVTTLIRAAPSLLSMAAPLIRATAGTVHKDSRIRYVPVGDDGGAVITLVPLATRGRETELFAVHRWSRDNVPMLARDLLRERGPWSDARVAMIDPQGLPILLPNLSPATMPALAAVPLTTLPQWKVAAFPLTGSVESLVTRESRRYLLLVLLAWGTVAVAMVLAVRSVAREIALSRLRADFIASVSHELRTPLALIRMFAENLQSGWVTEEKRAGYYDMLMQESDRLSGLINNVLDFSRIEAGTRKYNLTLTDVRQLLGEILDRYRGHLAAQGITLVEDFPSTPIQARVDRQAIEQVVINLLSNAAKYLREDERRITASLTAADDRVLITIADTGFGLTGEQQSRIFDRFYRADDSRVHAVAGSGIGLTLVKHIVGAHGGEIRVQSLVNKGSAFTIVLPACGHV